MEFGIADLEAISAQLGDKPYLMGDDPCDADFSLFGFSVQFLLGSPSDSPYATAIRERFTNIERHMIRIKESEWTDWNQCLAK
jgi:glutathione S-transferase